MYIELLLNSSNRN